jgi:hypothetical protein
MVPINPYTVCGGANNDVFSATINFKKSCHVLCRLIFAEALSMMRAVPDVVAAKAKAVLDW